MDSILEQSYGDFEFLIIDDASSDRTPAILESYAQKDDRIRIERNPENLGLTASLNRGLELARGEFIARQDADDISLPMRLDAQRRILQSDPEVVLVSGRIEMIDEAGEITGKVRPSRHASEPVIPWILLFYNYLSGHSLAMFRRGQVLELGGYDLSFHQSQDYDLWLRLARVGRIRVPEIMLLQLRMHNESISKRQQQAQRKSGMRGSAQAIERLSGLSLKRSDVKQLRSFWKGRFEKAGKPHHIHAMLLPIYKAFAERGGIGDRPPGPEVMDAIRRLIQKQFSLWERNASFFEQPIRRFRASRGAKWWRNPPPGYD
jgi:hypothetical protein